MDSPRPRHMPIRPSLRGALMRAAWWWIDRWQKSTAFKDMTLEEQGAYRNLLDELWLRDGGLPNDERILARLCGDSLAWERVRVAVLAHFQLVKGRWQHPTQLAVMHQARYLSGVRATAGKAGAAARWLGNENGKPSNKPHGKPMANEKSPAKGAKFKNFDLAKS